MSIPDLDLTLVRHAKGRNSTGGLLYIEDKFVCYTCEDEERDVKVKGETAIPPDRYEIKLRNEGGMTKRYAKRFPGIHKGMLWLQDVPGFEWIYIHPGNDESHTDGCILPGYGARCVDGESTVQTSTPAYQEIYTRIIHAMDKGQKVFIKITSS